MTFHQFYASGWILFFLYLICQVEAGSGHYYFTACIWKKIVSFVQGGLRNDLSTSSCCFNYFCCLCIYFATFASVPWWHPLWYHYATMYECMHVCTKYGGNTLVSLSKLLQVWKEEIAFPVLYTFEIRSFISMFWQQIYVLTTTWITCIVNL